MLYITLFKLSHALALILRLFVTLYYGTPPPVPPGIPEYYILFMDDFYPPNSNL